MAIRRIRRLAVSSLRGIRAQRFLTFEEKSVVLLGPNGSGKSSFVEALELAMTGQLRSLTGKAGISFARHAPHIRNPDYSVEITFSDGTTVRRTSGGVTGALPPGYAAGAPEVGAYVLRRRQLLDFIEAQPSARYDLIKAFLPLDRAIALEERLNGVNRTTSLSSTKASELRNAAIRRVRTAARLPISNEPPLEADVIRDVGNRFLEADLPRVEAIANLERARDYLTQRLALEGIPNDLRVALALERASQEVQGIDYGALEQALGAARTPTTGESHFHEGVLTEGRDWIQESQRDDCPLCEQAFVEQSRDAVLTRIAHRLSDQAHQIRANQVLREEISRVAVALRIATQAIAPEQPGPIPASPRDEDTRRDPLALADVSEALGAVVAAVAAESSDVAKADRLLASREALDAIAAALYQTVGGPRGDTADVAMIIGLRDDVVELLEASTALATAERDAERAGIADRKARALLAAFTNARKAAVQRVLDEISGDIQSLYEFIHAEDSDAGTHTDIGLHLRDAFSRSVEFRSSFYDRVGDDPRAFYSEAHLDTLGIAAFLALRKWHRRRFPEFPLLVIDDAVTSVDAAHALQLATLLMTEFRDYQQLITTHDSIYFEHLRGLQGRLRGARAYSNRQILDWSIDDGPNVLEPYDHAEHLRSELGRAPAYELAVGAGRLLEHLLQEMRFILELSIQAKRGERYEIGQMWPIFYSTVEKEYPAFYSATSETLAALDSRWHLRNIQGAHFNTFAENIPRDGAVSFARRVLDLFDKTYCAQCRKFVQPGRVPKGTLGCPPGHIVYITTASPEVSEGASLGALTGSRLRVLDHVAAQQAAEEAG